MMTCIAPNYFTHVDNGGETVFADFARNCRSWRCTLQNIFSCFPASQQTWPSMMHETWHPGYNKNAECSCPVNFRSQKADNMLLHICQLEFGATEEPIITETCHICALLQVNPRPTSGMTEGTTKTVAQLLYDELPLALNPHTLHVCCHGDH